MSGIYVVAIGKDNGRGYGSDETDADGHFTVSMFGPTAYALTYQDFLGDGGVVRWNDGATGLDAAPAIQVQPGETVTHNDALAYADPLGQPHTLSGQVIDSDTNPLGGIAVTATDQSGNALRTSTDREGVWALNAPDGDWTIRYEQSAWWSTPRIATPWMVTYYPGVWLADNAETVTLDREVGPASVGNLDLTLRRSARYLGHTHATEFDEVNDEVYDLDGQLVYRSPWPRPADGIIVPPGRWKILMTNHIGGASPHDYVPQWLTPDPAIGSPSSFEGAFVFDVVEGYNSHAVYDIWFVPDLRPLTPPYLSVDDYTGVPVGTTLTFTPAVWNQSWQTTTRVTWLRDGKTEIATGTTYTTTLADAGHRIIAAEHASNGTLRAVAQDEVTAARLRSHISVTNIKHRRHSIRFVIHVNARLGIPEGVVHGANNYGYTHRPFQARLHNGKATVTLTDQPRGTHRIDLDYYSKSYTYSEAHFRVRL
ncbi:MAG: carboxypeptidase-like regulatory domain-containing protein [Nocardioidaceae bacterium]